MLSEVSQLCQNAHIGGVVVTGRSFLVDELGQHEHILQIVFTREPRPEEARAFVTKFVQLRRGTQAHAQDLITRIEQDADLRALARTPLMLAFMTILDELEGRLPDRRIEIYYRLGEMLVDRWTRSRSIGMSSHFRDRPTRADALRVLGPLAWWTVERGGGTVHEAELYREIERIECRRETPTEASKRATALLELLRSDTALLVPRPGNRWSFVHGSIGEYFAGVEVERDRQRWAALLENPFRAEWREIAIFCAGNLGVIEGRVDSLDTLVTAIMKKSHRPGRYDAKYPSLFIGLLEESPGLSRQQIDDLVERLLKLTLTNSYSGVVKPRVQLELVSFLSEARSGVAQSLGSALRRWFSRHSANIRWDRIFPNRSALPPSIWLHRIFMQAPAKLIAHIALGPLVASMVDSWITTYNIDLSPTLQHWEQQTNWRYRFAKWLITSDESARQQPFEDVLPQFMPPSEPPGQASPPALPSPQ
ncbi:MAG: hypothetical protein HC927_03985 [Deltaproteobacteria bacterium]|nr:hypothetical protein [Deltaproteobacteria bacterium]